MNDMPKINCLYEKYLNSPIPKKYNCKEIQELFIAKYDAKIMDIKEMTLFLDPLEVDSFCACLMIDNCDILNRIFTKEEKQGFRIFSNTINNIHLMYLLQEVRMNIRVFKRENMYLFSFL